MIIGFLRLSISSIIIGISVGLLTSYMLKNIPEIDLSPIKELMIMIVMAYLSFLIAEYLRLSGVISLFCCGFTLSHYGYHNISPVG